MTDLTARLAARIRSHGAIGIDAYMETCLADPEAGYYTTRDPLGRLGDFTTAPEISQIFGEIMGLWCAVMWQRLGEPKSFHLIELGPGRGTMMADMLRAMAQLPACRAAAKVHLVETSPALRTRQRETLQQCQPETAIRWHDSVQDLPANGPLLIVANEFFDALPIRQWHRREGQWRERLVGMSQAALSFIEGSPMLPPGLIPDAEEGDILETAEPAWAVTQALGQRLSDQGGTCLVIDYGHARTACGDTLQALKQHRRAGIFETPGTCDLTAHVDFERLGGAAISGGAEISPVVTQRQFLTALGGAQRCEALTRGEDAAIAAALQAGWLRLVDPAGMGSLFKVMALAAKGLGPMPGFER